MDNAYWDHTTWGNFRWDVFIPHWDTAKEQLAKQLPAKSAGGIDPCLGGRARAGHVRANVTYPIYDELKERLKKGM